MTSRSTSGRRLVLALLLAPLAGAALAASYELVVPAPHAGGGALAGGDYTAFTTLTARHDAAPMPLAGGPYEVTPGIVRRRSSTPLPDDVFIDGFE